MYATVKASRIMPSASRATEYTAPYFHDECITTENVGSDGRKVIWLGNVEKRFSEHKCEGCGKPLLMTTEKKARLRITVSSYRGRDGFLISGQDGRGHRISIFTESRSSAEHIRERVRAGLEIRTEDFRDRSVLARLRP